MYILLSVLTLLNGLLVSFFILFFITASFFKKANRVSSLKRVVLSLISSVLESHVGKPLLFFLFVIFLLTNLRGNIPLNSIPTIFYSFTFRIRLLFWAPIILCVFKTQIKSFVAHMLPFGAPTALIIFLPLVEIFSQLIRPLTLIIRLRTNLSSGHIIMYMFSYFTLLSSALSPFIYIVLYLLFFLELAISMLQAYIFVSLLSLYINETA
jgi:ATP synthase subunit 6